MLGSTGRDTLHCPPGLHRLLDKKNRENVHRMRDFSIESSKGRYVPFLWGNGKSTTRKHLGYKILRFFPNRWLKCNLTPVTSKCQIAISKTCREDNGEDIVSHMVTVHSSTDMVKRKVRTLRCLPELLTNKGWPCRAVALMLSADIWARLSQLGHMRNFGIWTPHLATSSCSKTTYYKGHNDYVSHSLQKHIEWL